MLNFHARWNRYCIKNLEVFELSRPMQSKSLGSVTVIEGWTGDRGFNSRPRHCRAATLGKSFTHVSSASEVSRPFGAIEIYLIYFFSSFLTLPKSPLCQLACLGCSGPRNCNAFSKWCYRNFLNSQCIVDVKAGAEVVASEEKR